MTSVISLRDFKEWRETPTLVLVDLHRAAAGIPEDDEGLELGSALANCRFALAHARARGFPVAFIRQFELPQSFEKALRFPLWMPGFAPRRSDMVFDRQRPSCYASPEFVDMTDHTGGHCVVAGLFGESSCLSTVIDAFHRRHRFTFLADASASRGHNGVSPSAMHDAVTNIISLYGNVARTQHWVRSTSRKAEAAR
jgi:nicotinamidase-related amidase